MYFPKIQNILLRGGLTCKIHILVPTLGEPSNRIFGKIWEVGPTEGGGSADPKFLSNFSRTTFTMINGQKCDETHST